MNRAVPLAGTSKSSGLLSLVMRARYVVLGVLVALMLVLGWRGRELMSQARPDEFVYLELSRSLEQGSYREIYLADAPLHAKYPPAYPAWLTVLRTVGGEREDLIRGANLVFLAGFALCLYGIVQAVAGVPVALATVGLVAINPTLLETGGSLLSEPLFLFLVGASLLFAVRARPDESRHAGWAVAFALAAFLTRTVGIALLVAIGVWLWHRRRRGELMAFAVASAVIVGGWFGYTASVPPVIAADSYGSDLTRGLSASGQTMLGRFLGSARLNLVGYSTQGLPWALAVPTFPGTVVDNVGWLAVMVTTLAAGVMVLWKTARAVGTYLITAGLVVLFWRWRVDRLLVPLLPFIIAAMLIGMHRLTSRLSGTGRLAAQAALVVLLGFGAARTALARDARMTRCDRAAPYVVPGCYGREAPALADAVEYMKRHLPSDGVVLTIMPPEVHYFTGHRTARAGLIAHLADTNTAVALRRRQISYLLFTEPTRRVRRQLVPPLLRSCADLGLVTRFDAGGFLLSTHRGPGTEDPCPLLSELALQPAPDSLP